VAAAQVKKSPFVNERPGRTLHGGTSRNGILLNADGVGVAGDES
jgi:hypothetical protein